MDNVPMLTTIDNPYNPFLQWDEWYAMDHHLGHNTCEFLARVADTYAPAFTPEQTDELLIRVIDEICRLNVRGIDMKVYRPSVTG